MSSHAVLTSRQHGELRVREERGAEMGDAIMSTVIVPDEFRRVQNEYPILFRRTAERDGFLALALFGFEAGENLFLEGDRWYARYRPLSIDVQPFLIGRDAPGSENRQVHVDMASPRIGAGEGVRVFDREGRPTPYLEAMAERLGALDAGLAQSGDFIAALQRHDLLEPFAFDVELDDGATHRLVGFHVIDEDRLRALDTPALAQLHADGHLLPIFMAVASLSNLAALVARKNRRSEHGRG